MNATYTPNTPLHCKVTDKSDTKIAITSGGTEANNRQHNFLVLIDMHEKRFAGIDTAILSPSVIAMSGNTLIVSRAGNITTRKDIAFAQIGIYSAERAKPQVNVAQFKFTLDEMRGPK